MGKTYLIGKIGKSVKFNPNTWTGLGGDVEAPTLFTKMAELNPDDTFVIISGNDLDKSREKMDLPNNLVSIYENCTKDERKDKYYIANKLKNVKIDGCFLMSGPTGSTNIVEASYTRKELEKGIKQYAKVLEVFQNYVQQMYVFLNESNIPWTLIVNDPRYTQLGRDLINPPKNILSQYNEDIVLKHFKDFEHQETLLQTKINATYAGMEKIFLLGSKKPKFEDFNKSIGKLIIPLNEGNNGVKSRYNELKKYVLDFVPDAEIYGKWDEATIQDDNRFKGTMPYHELQELLYKSVKYSFMISISEGWVTMKIWEFISNGVIPFMHPNYDTQNNCKVPDFIKIKNPKDLQEKIEFLENNPGEYEKLLKECLSLITDGDIDGTTMWNTFMTNVPVVNKLGSEYTELYKSTIKEKEINAKQTANLDDW